MATGSKSPIEQYLTTAGLTEELPNLRVLAQRLVAQIDQEAGIYQPKRPGGRAPVVSRGWSERLKNYEWSARVGFIKACSQVGELEGSLGELAIKIDRGEPLDMCEAAELQRITRLIFEWGGVTRGD